VIISNHYLAIYLASFLDIPSTINLMRTSGIYYDLITTMTRY
jgi:hypothetical protein